jgi:pimeloyl-ACP methyl ester carboxylesterase
VSYVPSEVSSRSRDVEIPIGAGHLAGRLDLPNAAIGVVLFAHGSGSSRFSPRNQQVAQTLQGQQLGTLLIDLLTAHEEQADQYGGHLRFDIDLLAARVESAIDWMTTQPDIAGLNVGLFGASTGAAAAIAAAASRPDKVQAVVSRGGRPDLAKGALTQLRAPTLLIVGGNDTVVLELNERARRAIHAPVELAIIPGASHLFEESGTLAQVADLAAGWFKRHLG